MIGDPEVIFWIIAAAAALVIVGFLGLGAVIIWVIELSLEEGSSNGTDERKEKASEREQGQGNS
jgi:hypothetical protein